MRLSNIIFDHRFKLGMGPATQQNRAFIVVEKQVYEMSVQFRLSAERRSSIGRITMVSVMLGLLLAISALAVSAQLHHLLHQDSQNANHHCLAAQLNKAPLAAGFAGVSIAAPTSVFLASVGFAEFRYFPSSDYRVSPSRAPPSASSSSTVVG